MADRTGWYVRVTHALGGVDGLEQRWGWRCVEVTYTDDGLEIESDNSWQAGGFLTPQLARADADAQDFDAMAGRT